jgi:hypothetical protein
MKAYRDASGGIRLFRPDLNMKRLKVRSGKGGIGDCVPPPPSSSS